MLNNPLISTSLRLSLRASLLLFLLFSTVLGAKTLPATNFKLVQEFINEMVVAHQFNKSELLFVFSQIHLKVATKSLIKKPKRKKTRRRQPMTWDKYKRLFITENRIKAGLKFWRTHQKTLDRAAKTYHIPSEIIVAILGIETHYGNKKGKHPTLKTLAQKAFSNHRRKKFYRNELRAFLLMTRENVISPLGIKGSHAGAMGYPQFISSSYRHYAVDFNLDGKIDLFSDPTDAIGSIANYFARHYWQKNGEFARPINLKKSQQKYAKQRTNKPRKSAQDWRKLGLNIDPNIDPKTKIAFISLPQNEADETWLTFWNFYVLTRYNHNNKYAMAAYQLARQLRQRFDQ